MGDVDGQRGLADAADAGQRRHGHHPSLGLAVPGRRCEDVAQFADEGGAAGEVRHRGGELGRADRGRGRFRGGRRRFGQGGVGAQDPLLEVAQRGARVDAEFLGQQAAGVGVHRERLGLASAAVERQHQQLAQAFAERVGRRQRGQFGDRLGVAALLQVHVEAGFEELEAPFLQADPLGLRVRAGHARQYLAVPEGERAAQHLARLAQVPGAARLLRLCRQVLGDRQVQRPVGQPAHRVAPDSLTRTPASRTLRSRDA